MQIVIDTNIMFSTLLSKNSDREEAFFRINALYKE